MNVPKLCSLVAAGAMVVWGQAAVEHTVGTGAAAGATTGARGAGQGIGGVFSGLSKALEKAGDSKSQDTSAPASASSRASVQRVTRTTADAGGNVPASKPIDPSVVVEGLTQAEVLELCGAPSTSLQQTRGSSLVETLWYPTIDGDELKVEIVDGKVASAVLASQKAARR